MEDVKVPDTETEKDAVVSSGPLIADGNNDGSDRKRVSVRGRMTGPTRRSSKGGWTEEEDKILAFAVQKFNGKNWKKIAECVPDRTDVQCLHRWQKVLHPDLVKGPWTKEEDDLIIELVGKQGNKKWSEIAKYLPGRIGKQCRERWHNHLNPEINKNAWTKEEEQALIEAHKIYGNKWAEIAKFLCGRTENSIKNHWNCSLKKKLDLHSVCGTAVSHPGFTTPSACIHKTERESRKFEVVKQKLGTTFSLDQKTDSERSMNACSRNLVLENSEGRENCLQSLKKGNFGIPREGSNDRIKLTFGACGLTGEKWQDGINSVKTSGDPHHIIAKQSGESYNTSLNYHVNFSCSKKHMHKSGDFINPSPPRPPSGYLSPSSSSPLDVTGRNGNYVPPCDVALPVNAKKSLQFPKGTHGNASSMNRLGIIDSSFIGESKNFHSFKPTYGGNEKSNDPETPLNLLNKNFGSLCYEPPQEEDLNIVLATGKFPSTDNYIRLPLSPVSFYTPTSHERCISVDYSSPESILRRAAMSFKNTPSIIRKRGLQTSRQAKNTNHSDIPEKNTDNLKKRLLSGNARPCVKDDLNSVVLPNAKEIFLSPPKSQKLENSAAIKSVEKRLEFAFDSVWDSANAKLNISAEGDSPGANHDSNGATNSSGL